MESGNDWTADPSRRGQLFGDLNVLDRAYEPHGNMYVLHIVKLTACKDGAPPPVSLHWSMTRNMSYGLRSKVQSGKLGPAPWRFELSKGTLK